MPGLNEIIGANRRHYHAGARQKKEETERCQWAILAGRVPTFTFPVWVRFVWVERDFRRDPDNITAGTKFVLDALVELKRIPGDSRRWIRGIEHEFALPEKEAPRIEVELTDEKGDL